jgi:signal transduction histidine kinase
MRERLFDSMVSVRPGSSGDVPHLGLGLYIVRLIAEFHGGTAHADNRADRKGVGVTVSMPLARDD